MSGLAFGSDESRVPSQEWKGGISGASAAEWRKSLFDVRP